MEFRIRIPILERLSSGCMISHSLAEEKRNEHTPESDDIQEEKGPEDQHGESIHEIDDLSGNPSFGALKIN